MTSRLQKGELIAWMQHSQLNFKLKARVNRSTPHPPQRPSAFRMPHRRP